MTMSTFDPAKPLAGKAIFITGATSGFGRRFAQVLGPRAPSWPSPAAGWNG
ncbi:hypothetical protein [Oleomonas cavernae]|uniref:hypothetical protein n=1 Tax=Oleomonas cavernae TaxID=2320859 RepID=UPI0018F5CD38|nr:hypothetical protein [Oleomonas cavernae]